MYYDLLVKIKNAEAAKKPSLTSLFSGMDFAVAEVLSKAGYIGGVCKKSVGQRNVLELKLAHGKNGPAVTGFKIMSKPSRRLYADYRSLRPVRQGYGLAVLSTSRGIMSNKDAKKQKVGGEYLFEIW